MFARPPVPPPQAGGERVRGHVSGRRDQAERARDGDVAVMAPRGSDERIIVA